MYLISNYALSKRHFPPFKIRRLHGHAFYNVIFNTIETGFKAINRDCFFNFLLNGYKFPKLFNRSQKYLKK